MHPPAVKQQAMELIEAGVNDCEISRRLGIARTTVRDWRRPTYVPREPTVPRMTCPRCWRAARPMVFTPDDYCELLGLYLGDGCISQHARTQHLRIFFDAKYPGLIGRAQSLLSRCFPANKNSVHRVTGCNEYVLAAYSQHLACLFPQHGPGKKNARPIVLERWQERLLAEAPIPFLRGCINSDGCVFLNRTGPYEYLSYEFTNTSEDIARLFVHACQLAGIESRLTFRPRRDGDGRLGRWSTRINRRASVNRLLPHIPPKA